MSGVASFPIAMKVFEKRPVGVTVRQWPKFAKASYAAGGALWHRKFLKDHFRRDARSKYGHQPRTAQYERRKKRLSKKGRGVKRGGRVDNVFSGTLERIVKGFVSIRAFPKRATAKMSGPRYLTMRPFKTNHPNMGKEITTVTEAEQKVIAKEIEQTMIGLINDQNTRKRTRV